MCNLSRTHTVVVSISNPLILAPAAVAASRSGAEEAQHAVADSLQCIKRYMDGWKLFTIFKIHQSATDV